MHFSKAWERHWCKSILLFLERDSYRFRSSSRSPCCFRRLFGLPLNKEASSFLGEGSGDWSTGFFPVFSLVDCSALVELFLLAQDAAVQALHRCLHDRDCSKLLVAMPPQQSVESALLRWQRKSQLCSATVVKETCSRSSGSQVATL